MPPKIDRSRCTGCGICLFQCGARVFTFDAERQRARVQRPRECVDCYICEKYCPKDAITVRVGKPK